MIKVFKDGNCELFKKTEINFNKNSYIVSIDDKIIGHFNAMFRSDGVLIDYELLKEYRGLGLGNYFLSIIEEYLSNNFEFDKFLLIIKYDNELSQKVALYNGYTIDYDMAEKMSIDGEMTMFSPYVKINEKNNKKSLN